MNIFWHCLLAGYIFTATVCGSEEEAMLRRTIPSLGEYPNDAEAAEDHEHHRIIIMVPKEIPHHVNHVHTYKLSGKGIPLIHMGKVVHDHKHNGKVKHDHGHAGKAAHSHKHSGAYGHQHKHAGHAAHKHAGKLHLVVGGKPPPPPPHHRVRLYQHLRAPVDHRPLLRTAAHHLHHQQQYQGGVDYRVQQHGPGGGISGVLGPAPGTVGRGPVSGQVHFVPSSRPHGLGSFIPHEIQQYVRHDGRYRPQQHYAQPPPPQQQQQQPRKPQQPPDDGADEDDEAAQVDDGPDTPPGYNVIRLRVPDEGGPQVIKSVDIDLTNNVAQLQTGEKVQQPAVTANYKSVTQYNKVIGHGRAVAPSAEEEFDAQSADDEDGDGGGGGGGGGGELLLEDVGYRFGEGYRLAMDSGGGGGGGGGGGESGDGDYSAALEQDDEELDEFSKEPSMNTEFVDPTDGEAYSQTYTMQY